MIARLERLERVCVLDKSNFTGESITECCHVHLCCRKVNDSSNLQLPFQ